jgi:hypothetical protein
MNDILKIQQDTVRYEFADGIREFHTAFWLLVTGLYAWVVWGLPDVWLPFAEFARSQGLVFSVLIAFVLPIVFPVLLSHLGLRVANEYVRRRWLWRNTGYIKHKAWMVPRAVLFTAYAIVFASFIGGILLAIQLQVMSFFLYGLYVGIGLAMAYMHWVVSMRFQIVRYRLVAVLGIAGTVLIGLLPIPLGLFPLAFSLFWTAILVISGCYGMFQVARQQEAIADAA